MATKTRKSSVRNQLATMAICHGYEKVQVALPLPGVCLAISDGYEKLMIVLCAHDSAIRDGYENV